MPKYKELTLPGANNKFDKEKINSPKSGDIEYALDMQVVAGATLGTVNLLLVNGPNPGGIQVRVVPVSQSAPVFSSFFFASV